MAPVRFDSAKGIDVRIGSIVIDCNDFPAMFTFWREALRYVPREPAEDGWVVLRDPKGRSVNVSLQRVPERRSGKNRLHLDLYTDDQKAEVERLLEIGATRHPGMQNPRRTSSSWRTPRATFFV